MEIKKGDFTILNPETITDGGLQDSDNAGNKKSGDPGELENAPGKIKKPKFDKDGVDRDKYERTIGDGEAIKSTKKYESKKAMGAGGNKEKIAEVWNRKLSAAMSSSGSNMKDAVRKLLVAITSNKPKVNWKKELKKFFDKSLNKYDYALPSKRHLAAGDVMYGAKKVGTDMIKTLVLAVDTSGSISIDQIKIFYEEVWRLSTKAEIEKIVLIYCSDDIDNVEILKTKEKPTLDKWASTGGNAKGFSPPFAYIEKNKINPTVVIYLTDSFAEYPAVNNYGINKYKEKVFWFICNATKDFDIPPFGKYIHVPLDSKGNLI